MDGNGTEAESIAFHGSGIIAVGKTDEVTAEAGVGADVVDLAGATVLPGFHDCHVHLMKHGLELRQIRLGEAEDLNSVLDAIRRKADESPVGEWILGSGLPFSLWSGRGLTLAVLDDAVPKHPVLLTSQDHHGAWTNTMALQLAGVFEDTPDPPGGRIQRDGAGHLCGLLLERAIPIVTRAIPEPTPEQLRVAVNDAGHDLARFGITTVHHMAYEPASYWRAIASAASDPNFPVRVWCSLPHEEISPAAAIGLATGQGGDDFCVGGAKFFADGALGPQTARMLEPYTGTEDLGMTVDGLDKLTVRFQLAFEAGLVPVTHAIGDAANRAVLDSLAATAGAWTGLDVAPRIEHAQHVHEDDIMRFGELGVTASMQPIHIPLDLATINAKLPDRLHRAYPMRKLISAGALLVFGSDTPIASPDLGPAVRAAVERRDSKGNTLTLEEALLPVEAVRAFTVDAARAIGRGDRSGMIRCGYHADFTIFDGDPIVLGSQADIYGTIKSGRWTFRKALG
jgi:predicted amidohydrolase YtcJ